MRQRSNEMAELVLYFII